LNRPRSYGGAACPSGWKSCAPAGVTLLNTTEATCWPNGQDCPLSDIRIDPLAMSSPYTCTGFSSNTMQFCISRYGVTPNSQYQSLPLTKTAFQLSDSTDAQSAKMMCFPGRDSASTPKESGSKPTTSSTADTRKKLMPTCAFTSDPNTNGVDPRWKFSDYYSELNVYTDNGVTNLQTDTSSSPPQMNAFMLSTMETKMSWAWSGLPEIYWSSSCPFTRQQVTADTPYVDKVVNATLAIVIIGILATLVDWCFNCSALRRGTTNGKSATCQHAVIFLSFSIGKLIALIVAFLAARHVTNDFQLVGDKYPGENKFGPGGSGCTDATTGKTFDFLYAEILNIAKINAAMIALAVIDIILQLKEIKHASEVQYETEFCISGASGGILPYCYGRTAEDLNSMGIKDPEGNPM